MAYRGVKRATGNVGRYALRFSPNRTSTSRETR